MEGWRVLLADSVVVTNYKLSQYYSNNDSPRDQIYNLATVLDPTQSLRIYMSNNFEPGLFEQYNKDFCKV